MTIEIGDAVRVRETDINFAHDRCTYDGQLEAIRTIALVTDANGFQFATYPDAIEKLEEPA